MNQKVSQRFRYGLYEMYTIKVLESMRVYENVRDPSIDLGYFENS